MYQPGTGGFVIEEILKDQDGGGGDTTDRKSVIDPADAGSLDGEAPVVTPVFLDAKGSGQFKTVAFFAQHGMYARIDPLMSEMITVDLWAFFMGSFLIVHLWREPTRDTTRATQR